MYTTITQCTKGDCHWTRFHAQVSYHFEDGENLIKCISARELGVVLSPEIMNAPLRIIQPIVPSHPGPVSCQGDCNYKGGGKPKALKTCIELKFKACCKLAFVEANTARKSCAACKGHDFPAVYSQLQAIAPPATPSITVTPPVPQHWLPPNVASETLLHKQPAAAATQPQPSFQSQPSTTPNNTSSSLTAVPGEKSSTSHGTRKRALAQPLGKNWLACKEEAENTRARQEDLKSRHNQMEEELKQTVELLIYFKVCFNFRERNNLLTSSLNSQIQIPLSFLAMSTLTRN